MYLERVRGLGVRVLGGLGGLGGFLKVYLERV